MRKIAFVAFIIFIGIAALWFLQKKQGDPAIGQDIYEKGILADGTPLTATLEGGALLSGEIVSCARCHRKSGFGSFEGNIYVPPITSDVLFKDEVTKREDLMRSLYHEEFTLRHWAKIRNLELRKAYDEASIKNALALGLNSNGKVLDPIMPKYDLNEENLQHLVAYLKTLNQQRAAGIDEQTVHFAAVIAGEIDPKKEKIWREFITTYVGWKNKNVVAELRTSSESPNYKEAFHHTYLKWKVHFWRLQGAEHTWKKQLEKYYRSQPVFALLSGLGEQSWQPVHAFAEANRLPSLFPNTEQPVDREDEYAVYFSKGMAGEAISLAKYFKTQHAPVIQVYEENEMSVVLKNTFENELSISSKSTQLISLKLEEFQSSNNEAWKAINETEQNINLVFWPSSSAGQQITLPDYLKNKVSVFLPFQSAKAMSEQFADVPIYYTFPYSLPDEKAPRNYRIRAWMRSRGLELLDEPLQMNTYFALSVTDFAVSHLVGNYSREYLIERIEHETENNLNPGIYPRLSLGPGQRFAAKGNYIVSMAGEKGIEVLGYF